MARASSRRWIHAPVLAAAVTLSACGGGPTAAPIPPSMPEPAALDCGPLPDGPIVIAGGARANAAAPKVTGKLAAVVRHAVESQSDVALLDSDRAPSVLTEGSFTLTSKNDGGMAEEVAANQSWLIGAVQAGEANDRQADPLTALDTAARKVHARSDTGTVVLIDSGLQTTGALRYQSGDLLLAAGSDVVGSLESAGQLPDLSGVTVLLLGIGDTAEPQERLDTATRNRLVEHWKAISRAAGATCVEVDEDPLTESPERNLPQVSRVHVPVPVQPSIEIDETVALREDSVGFVDDSAELRDPVAAMKALKPMASDIREGGYRVSLVGTTASAGTEEGRLTLSLERAETVEGLLVDLGVPDNRISTRGVGTHHPRHVDDLDENRNLIPEAAVKNRAVFVEVRV